MSNEAAWLTAAKVNPFENKEAPIPTPQAHEVVIRSHAAAINPVDFAMQAMDFLINAYPAVLGCDGAGEVVAVGAEVAAFQKGDRVLACADFIETQRNTNSAFQYYFATHQNLVAKIPASVPYVEAAVLPLALSTAAAGLFQEDTLALRLPKADPTPTGEVVVVWGGSSSVGSCAIQLAKGAGYTVAATAGASNQEYVKSLGAAHVFDHRSPTVVEDIVAALKGQKIAGVFDTVANAESIPKSVPVLLGLTSGGILQTVLPASMPAPPLPEQVKLGTVFGLSPAHNAVGPGVFHTWVPVALANGTLQCRPTPEIVGSGLESLQLGCNKYAGGVSAKKLVVEL